MLNLQESYNIGQIPEDKCLWQDSWEILQYRSPEVGGRENQRWISIETFCF